MNLAKRSRFFLVQERNRTFRFGRFGLETFRSDDEILQKSYINAKYNDRFSLNIR